MCHPDWTDQVGQGIRSDVDLPDGDRMPGWRYDTATRSGAPILLLPDIYGPVPFYRHLAGRLAEQGHPTLLVDLFFRDSQLERPDRELAFQRLSEFDAARSLDDAQAAAVELAGEAGLVGVLGFRLGGQLALDLAARMNSLVTLCFYAFPEGVSAPVKTPAPRPIDLAEDITGPILAFWGDQDYIPVEVIERFGKAMAEHGVDYDGRILTGAGHGFLQGIVDDRPDSETAHKAWSTAVAFLDTELVTGDPDHR